jgi:ATPase subunit of ABC transporter with duplicated ATPase domains
VQLAQLQSIMKDDVYYAQEVAENVKRLERGLEWRDEALEQHIRKILHVEQDTLHRIYQDRILKSLRFDSMGSRQEQIRDPRGHTYSWILNYKNQKSHADYRRTQNHDVAEKTEKNKENAHQKLLDWLSSGRDILHISGKLGSGKSTLIKFIFSHKHTRERLEKWAGMLTTPFTPSANQFSH